jgi:hypothetical protein
MKLLERLRDRHTATAEAERSRLIAMQTWMRIGLDRIHGIELNSEELSERIAMGDRSWANRGPSGLEKSMIVQAGKRALIEREEAQLAKEAHACFGARVRITRTQTEDERPPRLYYGDDFEIQSGEIITGRIDGVSLCENGWLKSGIIELIEAESTAHPGMYAPPTSPLSVHHVFSQRDGIWTPTVNIEPAA